MLEVFASAYPGTGLQSVTFSIAIPNYISTSLVVAPGGHATDRIITAPSSAPFSLELSVAHANKHIKIHADDIDDNSQIHLFATNPSLFIGNIVHETPPLLRGGAQIQTKCQLRCMPTDKPVAGPGCLSCSDDGVIFRVCC